MYRGLLAAAVVAALLCAGHAGKPKTAADWKKLEKDRLGDLDASWGATDSLEDLETDNDVLYNEMQRRQQQAPDVESLNSAYAI